MHITATNQLYWVTASSPVTMQNVTGATVYYASTRETLNVATGTYDGSIAAGASLAVTSPKWLACAVGASADLSIVETPLPVGSGTPTITAAGNLGATEAVALVATQEKWVTGTLDANVTITVTPAVGGRVRLFLTQDATGSRTVTISDGTTSALVTVDPDPLALSILDVDSIDGVGLVVTPVGGVGPEGPQGPIGPTGPTGPTGPFGAPADASASTKGISRVVGTISTAADPYVRSAEDDVIQVLTSTVGPIASQIVVQPITGLGLAITGSATERWLLDVLLIVTAANATMDFKCGFTVPAGCTGYWGIAGGLHSEIASWGGRNTSQTPVAASAIASHITLGSGGVTFLVPMKALILGGGAAGTVQPVYAQATSDAGNLSILAGSMLKATRVAA